MVGFSTNSKFGSIHVSQNQTEYAKKRRNGNESRIFEEGEEGLFGQFFPKAA